MAATDPDFLSLVEANRFQPSNVAGPSPKAQVRIQERKKAHWNESICLRLVPPPSFASLTAENTTKEWKIPRFRLTESFLQDTVNRAKPLVSDRLSPLLLVSHVHDRKTNTVILPAELQARCLVSVVYDVIVRSAVQVRQGGVLSGAGDSYYNGDLIFVIQNVPNLSESERHEVVAEDVHRWIVNGAINGLEEIQVLMDRIKTLQRNLQQLEKDIKNINAAPIYNEHGRAILGSPLKAARETKLEYLMNEKEQTKHRIGLAEQSEEAARARHFSACSLTVTKRSDEKDGSGKSSFSAKVTGKRKNKEYYQGLISDASDWNFVHLYATGERTAKTKSRKKPNNKREEGKVIVLAIAEEDRGDHIVDVSTVSIAILPDGFGVHEAYCVLNPFATKENGGTEDGSARHTLFHGHFREGQYHKGTMHSDAGVYSGTFVSNEPCKGTMKFSDGIILEGDFSMPPEQKGDRRCDDDGGGEEFKDNSPLGQNPYRRGVPHGNVHVQFKNGASYEGVMHRGGITGTGCVLTPVAEIDGDFVDGRLQNNDGVRGQGGSNLLRSLMIGGERLWGP